MRLWINGESREVEQADTIADLLRSFKLDNKILVVELNTQIVDRGAYAETALSDGDRLEIVHFVGGG